MHSPATPTNELTSTPLLGTEANVNSNKPDKETPTPSGRAAYQGHK